MLAHAAFPATHSPLSKPAIVVEVIGDLDASAARSFEEAAVRLAPEPGERVVLDLQRAMLRDAAGTSALQRTLLGLQRRSIDVDIVAGARRARTALAAVRIRARDLLPGDHEARDRHVMIVRNADPKRDII